MVHEVLAQEVLVGRHRHPAQVSHRLTELANLLVLCDTQLSALQVEGLFRSVVIGSLCAPETRCAVQFLLRTLPLDMATKPQAPAGGRPSLHGMPPTDPTGMGADVAVRGREFVCVWGGGTVVPHHTMILVVNGRAVQRPLAPHLCVCVTMCLSACGHP